MRAPEFWNGRTAGARLVATLLSPLGSLYGAWTAAAARRARPARAKAVVVCVGNLTAGGTGKTPVALAIAKIALARGERVVFLTRGYGGRLAGPVRVDAENHTASDVGDEALLLAQVAPTIVARDRGAGAALADAQNADVIVMDDGFQNFGLAKDLSLVVVDAQTGFGNGRLIPAGPLREPVTSGLARADAVILVGAGAPRLPFRGPVLRAELKPRAGEQWRDQKLFAFAGIGRPEKFFASLRALGAEVQEKAFPDHHSFTAAELADLRATAKREGLTLVTTEKDMMRIRPDQRRGIGVAPVDAEFQDMPALLSLLDRAIAAKRTAA